MAELTSQELKQWDTFSKKNKKEAPKNFPITDENGLEVNLLSAIKKDFDEQYSGANTDKDGE